MGRRPSSSSVLLTVLLALLIAAGAVGGAIYLRTRSNTPAASTPQPVPEPTSRSTGGCRTEPCQVLAGIMVANTKVELVVDAGGKSGRLRIGDRLIELTVTERGVPLSSSSLTCVAGAMSACLVQGEYSGGTEGEVVVGRSGKWSATERLYFSDTGRLSLVDITGEGTPEVLAVQQGFFVQAFTLDGTELGCTKPVGKLNLLPGWPTVKPTTAQLKPCAT